jgi:hypothetical protein
MSTTNAKKESMPSQVRLVVEVDGNPIGFLNLDLERLWPLISHRKSDPIPVEWIDSAKFESMVRAVVMKRLISRIEERLYQTLGEEMVKAELDVENVILKADAAAQVFGRTRREIEKFVAESGRTATDFYTFFWEYMLEDREANDLKKEWKGRDIPPR